MDTESFIKQVLSYQESKPFFSLAAEGAESSFILKKLTSKILDRSLLRLIAPVAGIKEIKEALFQKDLFVEKSFVIVENTELLPASVLTQLKEICSQSCDTPLLLCFNKLHSQAVKQLFFQGTVQYNLLAEKPWETAGRLAHFAKTYLKEKHKTIDTATLEVLIQNAQNDILFLESELNKLVTYTQGSEKISLQDVYDITTLITSSSGWQIGEGLLRRDLPFVASLLAAQVQDETSLIGCIHQIRYMIRQYLEIKTLWMKEKNPTPIQKAYPALRSTKLQKILELLESFQLEQFEETLSKLMDFEILVKSQSLSFDAMNTHLLLLLEHTMGIVHA